MLPLKGRCREDERRGSFDPARPAAPGRAISGQAPGKCARGFPAKNTSAKGAGQATAHFTLDLQILKTLETRLLFHQGLPPSKLQATCTAFAISQKVIIFLFTPLLDGRRPCAPDDRLVIFSRSGSPKSYKFPVQPARGRRASRR